MSPPFPAPEPSSQRHSTLVVVVAVVVVLAMVAVGVGVAGVAVLSFLRSSQPNAAPAAPPSATAPLPATPPQLARFYDQEIDWSGCGTNQCGRLTVPLDYADPAGETLSLAVLRVPATDRGQRVGQLVVNPGGPGGSGVQYAAGGAQVFGEQLTRLFDIVGFDPRGVGSSTPLSCMDTAQTDAVIASDPDPDTPAEVAELDRLTREFGEGCLSKSGDLARHMSTVEAAKDIDVLRDALGEPALDYLGASYGTLLGATYAELFPAHVGHMVLDGAIDPSLSNEELALGQAGGFEVALRAYLAACVAKGDCVNGDTVDAGARRIRQFLDEVDARPLPTGTERELTAGLATLGIWLPLYVKEYWPLLTAALEKAYDGNGRALLQLADQYTSRSEKEYADNSIEALYAINCLDHDDYIESSEVPSRFARFDAASPTFGRSFAYSLSTCASWPVKSGNTTSTITAAGAAPIVVIGTTRDPATPYAWAEGLAAQLASGRLVTRDGDGHTGFNQGNACVDEAVEGYLLRDVVPQDGLSC